MNKKILYIDMDGVLVNLGDEITRWFAAHPHLKDKFKNNPDHITGLFRFPKPNKGALSAIKKLYDTMPVRCQKCINAEGGRFIM